MVALPPLIKALAGIPVSGKSDAVVPFMDQGLRESVGRGGVFHHDHVAKLIVGE